MSPLRKFVIIPLGVLLLLVLALYFVFVTPYKKSPPAILGSVQEFSLTDSESQTFTDKNLAKKVWVADFMFTSCGAVCPLMTAKMQNLYRSYEREEGVNFVSITVDPDVDTPEKLAQYAKKYSINTQKWHFLTGPYEKIRELAVNSFKVGKVDEAIFHSEKFILVDQNMKIRGYYDFNDAEQMKNLFHDIALVAQE